MVPRGGAGKDNVARTAWNAVCRCGCEDGVKTTGPSWLSAMTDSRIRSQNFVEASRKVSMVSAVWEEIVPSRKKENK